MLKELKIRNFQSHNRSLIKFHKGVNAIVGPSDCGKSAILRALRWVLFNDQPGEAYRRHGSDKTTASLTIGGINHTRVRSNKDNQYIIEAEDGHPEPQVFDKVKNDVPEELTRAFNMDDINVQKQMDAPFLLSESPAEVGRILNRAAGIDDIDTCMSKINSKELENSKELKIRTNDLGDLDGELSKYRRLPDIEAKLWGMEELDKSLKKNRAQVDGIEEALAGLEKVEGLIEKITPLASISLEAVMALYDKQEKAERKVLDLGSTIEAVEKVNSGIEGFMGIASLDIEGAVGISAELAKIEKSVDSLEQFLSDVEEVDGDHKDKKKQLTGYEKEFKELMPDTCPLCQQEV